MPARYFTNPEDLARYMSGIAARGKIEAPSPNTIADGAYFDLDDGVNPAVRFYFNKSGDYEPGGGYDATNIELDVSAATDNIDVATVIHDAINAVDAELAITADDLFAGSAEIVLVNDEVNGELGNVPITGDTIPSDMKIRGMAGGAGPVAAEDFIAIAKKDNQFVLFHR